MQINTIMKLNFPYFGASPVFNMNNICILLTLVVFMNFQINYSFLIGLDVAENFIFLLFFKLAFTTISLSFLYN